MLMKLNRNKKTIHKRIVDLLLNIVVPILVSVVTTILIRKFI